MDAAVGLIELGKYGVVGIILALIALIAFVCWMFWRVTTNHIEHTNEAFNKNTEALTKNTAMFESFKDFIEIIAKK